MTKGGLAGFLNLLLCFILGNLFALALVMHMEGELWNIGSEKEEDEPSGHVIHNLGEQGRLGGHFKANALLESEFGAISNGRHQMLEQKAAQTQGDQLGSPYLADANTAMSSVKVVPRVSVKEFASGGSSGNPTKGKKLKMSSMLQKLMPDTSQSIPRAGGGARTNLEKVTRLLQQTPDIIMNRELVERNGSISCGGKPIMHFKTYQQVAAADPGFLSVLPLSDVLTGAVEKEREPQAQERGRGKRYDTCAVVGNSGALLENKLGATIDTYDAVVRFNAAPTRGFEPYVGSKTTIRLQNVDSLGVRGLDGRGTILVFTARDEKDVRKYVRQRRGDPGRQQYMFSAEWWCHIWQWVGHKGLKPSTGVAGVVLAMHLCSSVHLFGFSHNASRFHYFNHIADKVAKKEVYEYHPLRAEAKLYQELKELGRIAIL